MRRISNNGWLLAMGLALAGCTAATTPQSVPPPGPLPANGAWEGRYQGWAKAPPGSGMRCQQDVKVSNFYVTGNRISFGQYFGTVQPSGEAVLSAIDPVIMGRFSAGVFTGRGRIEESEPGCSYEFTLARVAS